MRKTGYATPSTGTGTAKKMNYDEIKKEIEALLALYKKNFNDETNEAINHYLKYDEYEMAFEGLFIEIMKHNNWKSSKEVSYYLEIGRQLSLDKESVFDSQFWSNMIKWSNNISSCPKSDIS